MDEIVISLAILIEIFIVLQCIQAVFQKNLTGGKAAVAVITIVSALYLAINFKILPGAFSVIPYIVIVVFCYYNFKEPLLNTIIKLVLGFSLAGFIEAIVSYVTSLILHQRDKTVVLFFSAIIALTVALSLRIAILTPRTRRIGEGKNTDKIIIISYGVIFVLLVVDYNLNGGIIDIFAISILAFFFIISIDIQRLERAQNEIQKKNDELELQKVYDGTYKKLLNEVRRKQHDYKNQMSAVYSMYLVAQSLEELVSMQKEYMDIITSDNQFDSILTSCDNSILAGYLYYKCSSCNNGGIVIEHEIHMQHASCSFALHEIIEVLGILIDNACENIEKEESSNKKISLTLKEDEEKIILSVANPAKKFSVSEIDRMFSRGYSTKGKDRGIGLARISELVRKNAARIKVGNFIDRNENWIVFTLEIAK